MKDFFELIGQLFIMLILTSIVALFAIWIITFVNSKECTVWNGEYSIYTGCLIKHEDKLLTLEQLKHLNLESITKPIETNMKISIKKEKNNERIKMSYMWGNTTKIWRS